jgi:hypothetical protein
MRIFFFLAVAFFVVMLIAVGVPTTIAGLAWPFWLGAALLCWLLDGAPNFTIARRNPPQ